MTFPITGFYTGMLGLIMIVLQVLVVVARARNDTLFGSGGKIEMLLPMRRHGNFIETVPLALIALGLAEAQGLGATWLHVAGGLLVLSRLVHPFGLRQSRAALPLRIAGTSGTWIATLVPIVVLLLRGVPA
ncbi:MAG: MAPEG family protein [Paracoccaceae bacterium]